MLLLLWLAILPAPALRAPIKAVPSVSETFGSDRLGTTTYGYDEAGRKVQKNTPDGWVSWGYDVAGYLAELNATMGPNRTHTWDAIGRLASVSVNGAAINYGYDPGNNLTLVTLPNGVSTDYAYDLLNRVTNVLSHNSHSNIAHFGYSRDATGKRISETNYLPEITFGQSYIDDSLNRLLNDTVTIPDPANPGTPLVDTTDYGFDPAGNRVSYEFSANGGSPTTLSYSYDANDRLAVAHTYDANGNTLTGVAPTGEAIQDEYDYENRLIRRRRASDGTVLLEFHYDAAGNRLRKLDYEDDRKTIYHVAEHNPTGYSQVLTEYREAISTGGSASYLIYYHGLDLCAVAESATIQTRYYGYDAHGNNGVQSHKL